MHFPPDPDSHAARSTAAVLLFVVCCLFSTGRMLFQAPGPRRSVDDIAKGSDQRFASLKARLSSSGVIGYIGDNGDSATPDYYLTQYALAPLVLDDSPDHEIVVGNFPSSPPSQLPQNLRLVHDFGEGVLLFAARDAN